MNVEPGSVKSNGNGTKVGNGGKTGRGAKGRKDAQKQEMALKDTVLRELSTELVRQKKAADDEAEAYSDMVKAAAEKTGYHAATIRSVVAALASDDFEDKKSKVEQLSLAFEALA